MTKDPDSLMSQKTDEEKSQPAKNEWENVQTFHDASFNSTVINIVNTVIGAGILSMGYCIRQGGLIGSVILILIVLIPSQVTVNYCSIASLYTGCGVYGQLGGKLYNKRVGTLVDIFVVLLTLGVTTAYMSILFEQLSDTLIDYCKVSEQFMDTNRWVFVRCRDDL